MNNLLILLSFIVFLNIYSNVAKASSINRIFKKVVDTADGSNKKFILNPDTGLNISEFLAKYNYPLESHDVFTEDGFILTTHRIPHGKNEKKSATTSTRPAIVFAHCLSCSSMDWIWQGPNNSLALFLADLGYDVWLANMRGNVHSMRHQTLSSDDKNFWEFSFHERGVYDMRATMDYILNITKLEKITYVGHSQGTSAGVALTTIHPEYNDKMNLMVLLSPVIYLDHMQSPLTQFFLDNGNLIKLGLNFFKIYGVPYLPIIRTTTEIFCNEYSSLQDFCIFVIDLFAGFDFEQVDKSKLTVFLSHTPSGFSLREVEHFLQEIKSASFRQYDYGSSLTNLLHYGASTPPEYDLSKLTAPLAIYYSKNDFLASVVDVERFVSQLRYDTVDRYLIDYELFNHLDFILAKDANTLLYDRVIKTIEKSNPRLK